jgi:hypothetical protein
MQPGHNKRAPKLEGGTMLTPLITTGSLLFLAAMLLALSPAIAALEPTPIPIRLY